MKKGTYRFISDPGHGWLEVPLAELITLGIAGTISSFSYLSVNGIAYLEEDCDAPRFDQAMRIKGGGSENWAEEVEDVYQDPTFVRELPAYTAPEPQQKTAPQPDDDQDNPISWTPGSEPLAEEGHASDLEDDARTAQAGDAFNLSPLADRPGWTLL